MESRVEGGFFFFFPKKNRKKNRLDPVFFDRRPMADQWPTSDELGLAVEVGETCHRFGNVDEEHVCGWAPTQSKTNQNKRITATKNRVATIRHRPLVAGKRCAKVKPHWLSFGVCVCVCVCVCVFIGARRFDEEKRKKTAFRRVVKKKEKKERKSKRGRPTKSVGRFFSLFFSFLVAFLFVFD